MANDAHTHIRWLYQELPTLVSHGIAPAEVAMRLREHYGEPESAGRRWAIIIFSVLGSLLIGRGVIEELYLNDKPIKQLLAEEAAEAKDR